MKEFTNFGELKYKRPDFEALKEFYTALNERVKNASTYAEVKACMQEEEEYSSRVSTMFTIASIRHTVDTSDKFYEEEDKYINMQYPEAMPYMQAFSLALLDSPGHRRGILRVFPEKHQARRGQFFRKKHQTHAGRKRIGRPVSAHHGVLQNPF